MSVTVERGRGRAHAGYAYRPGLTFAETVQNADPAYPPPAELIKRALDHVTERAVGAVVLAASELQGPPALTVATYGTALVLQTAALDGRPSVRAVIETARMGAGRGSDRVEARVRFECWPAS